MTGERFSTFPLTRTTGIMQFTDPALTTLRLSSTLFPAAA